MCITYKEAHTNRQNKWHSKNQISYKAIILSVDNQSDAWKKEKIINPTKKEKRKEIVQSLSGDKKTPEPRESI